MNGLGGFPYFLQLESEFGIRLAWRILWTEEPPGLGCCPGLLPRAGLDWVAVHGVAQSQTKHSMA